MKLDQLIDKVTSNSKFRKYFAWFRTLFDLPTYHSQNPIVMSFSSHTFLNVCTKTFKLVNYIRYKLKDCIMLPFHQKQRVPAISFRFSQ